MNLAPDFVQQYFDDSGNPLAGGLVYSYIAGTSTLQSTYTGASGGTANANPVVLDSNGRAAIWLDPTLSYKLVIKTSAGVTIKTVDTIAGSAASGIPTWNANTTYSMGNIVADGSGYGLLYVSLQNSNLNNALTDVAYWRVFQGRVRTVTADTTLTVTDDSVLSNSTAAARVITLPACSTTPIGKRVTVKDIGDGTYVTQLVGAGSDTIDSSTAYVTLDREGTTVENSGTGWHRIGHVVPPGKIEMYGGTTAPAGYLLSMAGTSYLRATYPRLYAAIGNAFGTADGTHFNVPAMAGRLPRGVDGSAGLDPDKASRGTMATGGNSGNNVGSVQTTATKLPTTAFTTGNESASHTHTIPTVRSDLTAGSSSSATGSSGSGGTSGSNSANHTHTITGGGDNESRPPNAYVNFIIKI